MKPANPRILTINGGSSSIKFALFEAGDSLRRILEGEIGRIGLPEATWRVKSLNQWYLARTEGLDAKRFNKMVNSQ